MPDIASVLKSEISRLARKESRAETAQVKKAANSHRTEIAELKRRIGALERQVRDLSRALAAHAPPRPAQADDGGAHRFSAKGLTSLRRRLGLSADDLGAVLGTSGQSVYNWENGTTRPRAESIARIAALRGTGKREVLRYLESLRGPA